MRQRAHKTKGIRNRKGTKRRMREDTSTLVDTLNDWQQDSIELEVGKVEKAQLCGCT